MERRVPRLYRAMREGRDGLPEVAASARALGVRPGIDVPVTAAGGLVARAMKIEEVIERALASRDPLQALRSLSQQLLAQGHSTAEVADFFEQARERFRAAGREADEDLLLDGMDFVTGWCSPHMRLDVKSGQSPPGEGSAASGPERELAPARPVDAAG